MSEISELESRIVAALGRIREAVEARASEGEGGDAEASALQAQLDVLEAERDAARMALETSATALQDAQARIGELESDVETLRETVQNLQGVNAELRVAASEGLGSADVINDALAADLAALQRARAEDLRDIETLLAKVGAAVGAATEGARNA